MIVVGVDPSLTSTGIATIDTEDRLVVPTSTIKSVGRKGDDWPTRRDRLTGIVRDVETHTRGADLVVVESPSLGQARQGGTLDRAGLFWLLLDRLYGHGMRVALVTPAGRAKYATGKGNAGKDSVLLAVARRYAHVDVEDNNQADSLVLALMGARALGVPVDEVPLSHRAAMGGVDWGCVVASQPVA